MSDSIPTIQTRNNKTGTTQVKVAPIPPERYSNGTDRGALSDSAVPAGTGARIPININGASRNSGSQATKMMNSALASVPDVMADESESQDETVEHQVNRLRPKTITMQLRFLYTVVFALWLFGRLIFWQVYIAKLFPQWVEKRNNKRWKQYAGEFRKFALRMGGVQIKAGQFASTRADVLPEEVIEELAGLQDKVSTISFRKIERVLLEELTTLDDKFEEIESEPIAAASLGQVHRAILKSSESVVVKVQRPNVRNIVYTDMAALFIVGHVAMRFDFVRRRVDAAMIVEEFGRVLLEEVSYEKEADNARRFKAMFADDNGIYVPEIYGDYSTDKIIVMEDVTSIKIDDYARLSAAGISREEVATRLMDTYLQQIFEDRFFHADPHPGNLFVYPLPVEDESIYIGKGGRPFYLIFIDFGMTAELTREIVQGLINTLTAVITRDSKRLVKSYQDLGFLMPDADIRRIEEATDRVFNEVWGLSMSDMTNLDFAVVENIGTEFNDLLSEMPFLVPQDFVYLGRTVAILTGMATKLDPTYNPWVEIQSQMQTLITTDEENNIFDEFAKIFQESLDEIMADGPEGFIRVSERVFKQIQRFNRTEQLLQQIVDGDIAIETRMSGQQKQQLQRIEAQNRRTSRTMLAGSLLICSTLLYTAGNETLAIAGGIVAGLMVVSTWFIRQ